MGAEGIIRVKKDVIDRFKVIMSETQMGTNQLMEHFFLLYNRNNVKIKTNSIGSQPFKSQYLNQDLDPKHKKPGEMQIKFRTMKSVLDKSEYRVYETTVDRSEIEDEETQSNANKTMIEQGDGTEVLDVRRIKDGQLQSSTISSIVMSKNLETQNTEKDGDGMFIKTDIVNLQKMANKSAPIQVIETDSDNNSPTKMMQNPVTHLTKAVQTHFKEETPMKDVVVTADKSCQIQVVNFSLKHLSTRKEKGEQYALMDSVSKVDHSKTVSGSCNRSSLNVIVMENNGGLQKADSRNRRLTINENNSHLQTDNKSMQQNAVKMNFHTYAGDSFEQYGGYNDGDDCLDDDDDSENYISNSFSESVNSKENGFDHTSLIEDIDDDLQNVASNSDVSMLMIGQHKSEERSEPTESSTSEKHEISQKVETSKGLPSGYCCPHCLKRLTTKSSLFYHEYYACNKVNRSFKCAACGLAFPEKSILNEHKCSLDPEKQFVCQICCESFAHLNTLVTHQVIHTGEKKYRCDKCDFKTAWSGGVKMHKMSVHQVPGNKTFYKCPECPYSSHNILCLRRHQRAQNHGKLDTHQCKMCGFEAKDFPSLRTHLKIHKLPKAGHNTVKPKVLTEVDNGDERSRCPYCSQQINHKWKRFYHKLYTCKKLDKSFKCASCGLGFPEDTTLANHKCSLNAERPYTCYQCGASYHSIVTFGEHQVTHSDGKKYSCDKCDFRTARLSLLQKHKAYKHVYAVDKKKPVHKCSECFYSSNNLYCLRRHQLAMKHKLFTCRTCGHKEKDYHSMKIHMIKHQTIDQVLGKRQLEYLKKRGLLHENYGNRKQSTVKFENILSSSEQKENVDFGTIVADKTSLLKDGTSYSKGAAIPESAEIYGKQESVGEVILSEDILTNLADLEKESFSCGVRNPTQCFICDRVFLTEAYMKRHIRRMHKIYSSKIPVDSKSCLYCGQKIATNYDLSLHIDYQCKLIKRPFKCSVCGLAFNRKSLLSRHICTKDPTKPYACVLCGDTFTLADDFVNHRMLEKKYKCEKCDYKSFGKKDVFKHMESKHSEKTEIYRCNECEYTTHVRRNLNRHLSTHGRKSCMCEWCGKIFGTPLTLEEHHKDEHVEPLEEEQCKLCEFKSKNYCTLKHHKEIHEKLNLLGTAAKMIYIDGSKDPRIQCQECSSTLSNILKFRRHVRTLHNSDKIVEPNRCSYCSRMLTSPQAVSIHQYYGCLKVGRSFKCSVCGLGFPSETVLAEHPCTRNPAKPYQCRLCESSCREIYVLIRHTSRHTAEKIYKCDQCTCEYAHMRDLTDHMTMKHVSVEDRPVFRCPECDYFTGVKKHLYKHKRIHKNHLFTCDVCGVDFRTQKAFARHDCDDHINSVKKTFKCDICDYKATTNKTMKKHLDKHSKGVYPNADLDENRAKTLKHGDTKSNVTRHSSSRLLDENTRNGKSLTVGNLNPANETTDAVNNIALEVEVVGTSASVIDIRHDDRNMNIYNGLSPVRQHQNLPVLSTLSRSQLDDALFLVSYGESVNENM